MPWYLQCRLTLCAALGQAFGPPPSDDALGDFNKHVEQITDKLSPGNFINERMEVCWHPGALCDFNARLQVVQPVRRQYKRSPRCGVQAQMRDMMCSNGQQIALGLAAAAVYSTVFHELKQQAKRHTQKHRWTAFSAITLDECTKAASLTATVCAQASWNSGAILDGCDAADWLLRPRARHAATRLDTVLSVVLPIERCAAAGPVRGWWGVDAAAPACVQGCDFRYVASPWLGSVGVSACIQLPSPCYGEGSSPALPGGRSQQRVLARAQQVVTRAQQVVLARVCMPGSGAHPATLWKCVRGITQIGLKVCDAWPCNGREEENTDWRGAHAGVFDAFCCRMRID